MSTSNHPQGLAQLQNSPADTPANLQSSEGSEPGLEHPEPLGSLEPNVPELEDWQLRGELAFGDSWWLAPLGHGGRGASEEPQWQ